MRQFLIPTTDPPVPLPSGAPWPAAGAEVEVDHYVRRRLAEGDLVVGEPPAAPVAEEAPESAPDAPASGADDTATDAGARRRKTREG